MIHKIYDSENYAMNLIKQSIKDMKYENNRSRYRFIDKLLDYYQGDDTGKYIQNYFKATAFKEIPLMSYNVTKQMIDIHHFFQIMFEKLPKCTILTSYLSFFWSHYKTSKEFLEMQLL